MYLRASKATEGRVRGDVRPAHVPNGAHVGDAVRVLAVHQGSVHDSGGQVQAAPSVVVQVDVHGQDLALICEANLQYHHGSQNAPGMMCSATAKSICQDLALVCQNPIAMPPWTTEVLLA